MLGTDVLFAKCVVLGYSWTGKISYINTELLSRRTWCNSRFVLIDKIHIRVFLVYDISSRNTFEHLGRWMTEVDTYSTKSDAIKMLVGNKIDKVGCCFYALSLTTIFDGIYELNQ